MHRKILVGAISSAVVLASLASLGVAQAPKTVKAAVIEDLHKAHKLLVLADHDYDGHRARAAEEVHKALKELGHASKKHHREPHPKEPQSASDAQLREAQQLLQAALTHLSTHHPRAHANVQAAIGEIGKALAIR
jgi:5S rRNA maturation endonuclease (ribonuclease M5)